MSPNVQWDVGASVGISVGFVPFAPTHLRNKGVVKETQGFTGAKKILGEGKESETNFGGETFVRAKVGWGDGIKGGSLQ